MLKAPGLGDAVIAALAHKYHAQGQGFPDSPQERRRRGEMPTSRQLWALRRAYKADGGGGGGAAGFVWGERTGAKEAPQCGQAIK